MPQRTWPVPACDDRQPIGEERDARAGIEQARFGHEPHLGLIRTDEGVDRSASHDLPRQDVGGREVEPHRNAALARVAWPQFLESCAQAHRGRHQDRFGLAAHTASGAALGGSSRRAHDGTQKERATHEVDCMLAMSGPAAELPGALRPRAYTIAGHRPAQ